MLKVLKLYKMIFFICMSSMTLMVFGRNKKFKKKNVKYKDAFSELNLLPTKQRVSEKLVDIKKLVPYIPARIRSFYKKLLVASFRRTTICKKTCKTSICYWYSTHIVREEEPMQQKEFDVIVQNINLDY